ncbi:hypothetical protein [Sphingomonas sp. MA1305]|uniref:hypothetical protein n=1 Tax=Sphingomonas sp. MA1305 TaxID=2479204 RepID=UPI0018DEFB59|nr:hypothetical protein [Sphingomonas sp. MA1305]
MVTSGNNSDQRELLELKLQEALKLAEDSDLTHVAAQIAEALDALPGPKHFI